MKLNIEGMMCMRCAARVQKALEAEGAKATIDLDGKCALVEADAADAEKLAAAVEKAGYKVVSIEK
ncbi:MAG: cation transporter [Clostridia bacterium]|nr:cation transporter [Clostridia bacterium]